MNELTDLDRKWKQEDEELKRQRRAQIIALLKQLTLLAAEYDYEVIHGEKGTLMPTLEAPTPTAAVASPPAPEILALFDKHAADFLPLILSAKDDVELNLRLRAFNDPKFDLPSAVGIGDLPIRCLAGKNLKRVLFVSRKQIKVIGRHSFKQKIVDVFHVMCGAHFDFDRMDLTDATLPPVFLATGKRLLPEDGKIKGGPMALSTESVRAAMHVSAPLALYFLHLFSRLELDLAIVKQDLETGIFNLTARGHALMLSRDLDEIGAVAALYTAIFPTKPQGLTSKWLHSKSQKTSAIELAEATILSLPATKEARTALDVQLKGVPTPPGRSGVPPHAMSGLRA
jgi:hypothetical protein